MANAMYSKGLENFLNANINWTVDSIRVVLVDLDAYVPDIANDQWLSAIPIAARTAVTDVVAPTAVGGVADADNPIFTAVTGNTSEALAIYKWTGSDGSSPLIAYIDDAANLPVVPGGGDIEIQWSDAGIFYI